MRNAKREVFAKNANAKNAIILAQPSELNTAVPIYCRSFDNSAGGVYIRQMQTERCGYPKICFNAALQALFIVKFI